MKEASSERKKSSLISWIMRYASTRRVLYQVSVGTALLGALLSMAPYYMMARVVKKLLSGESSFSAYQMDFILAALFWTLRTLLHSISTSCSHKATFSVLGNIRKALCEKLTRMPLGDVQSIPSGSLKSIIVDRVDSMETTLAHILPEFTANLAVPFFLFLYLLRIDWRMAIASLLTLPVGVICMMGMMRGYTERWQNCIEKTKLLNDAAVEFINGIEVIKAFGKADSSYEKFEKAAKDGAYCYIDWMKSTLWYFAAARSIVPATMLTILPLGGILYLRGLLSAPDFIMVIILASGLIAPLLTVMSFEDDIAKARTIFDEVGEILKRTEMHRPVKTEEEPKNSGIVLRDVHFSYEKGQEILHGIDLAFLPGTVNALVGPSGSGKSTIARLVASLWDVDEGGIFLGGTDIRKISFEDYNRRVAYVSQDNYLFNTSIRENIRMGRRGATDEEVEEAAKQCGCHDFILGLEKGYDTIAGDSGGQLSGGEKQRICIARALLKNAEIIILDEATAYTDPENEALIQRSLAQVIKGKTLIVIAHRLSTIADADQIALIEGGCLRACGTQEELLRESELYRRMWEAHISSRDTDREETDHA